MKSLIKKVSRFTNHFIRNCYLLIQKFHLLDTYIVRFRSAGNLIGLCKAIC